MKAWKTTSGTPSWVASSIAASMCSQPEWTPPSETSPSRWSLPAGAAAGALAGRPQGLVLEEAAVGDRVVDPGQVLLDDGAGAEVEVADLGVAHLPLGKADVAPLGRELGVGELRPEPVEDRRLGDRDRVAGAGLGDAPAVEDDQRDRGSRWRHYPAASTIAANSAGSRLAPPTSAPSMSGWAISSAALSGLTEPP